MFVWTDGSVVMHCSCRRPKLRSQPHIQCLTVVIPAPGNLTSFVTTEGIVFMRKPLQRHLHPPIKYYTVALWEQG